MKYKVLILNNEMQGYGEKFGYDIWKEWNASEFLNAPGDTLH
jgi:hypothetical protein